MSKRSPGPWRAVTDESPDAEIYDATGWDIARVYFTRDNYMEDARLIASAPELLEALRSFVEVIQGTETPHTMAPMQVAKALIRRIEGDPAP